MMENVPGAFVHGGTNQVTPLPEGFGVQVDTTAADVTATGIFFDTKNRRVVEGEPEEGIQLAAPGSVVSEALRAEIDEYQAAESAAEQFRRTHTKEKA